MAQVDRSLEGRWALILGASSGFGRATACELARYGVHIVGVHLDRKSALGQVEELKQEIQGYGVEALFFNMNAASEAKRQKVLEVFQQRKIEIGILLHSLAFGTLRRFIPEQSSERLTKEQMDMTLEVMAHSLVYWVQDLYYSGCLARGARIFAMTSSGSERVWPHYGAVSAAKAALESHCRQLALELAPFEVTVNALRAGVTDTPALRKIPGHEVMIEVASKRNPRKRLTTPDDVAKAVRLLSSAEAYWVTGNVINVDGGENITE